MTEPTYVVVNEVYELLEGVRATGGNLSATDLAYIVGSLHGVLAPYTEPKQPVERGKVSRWRRLISRITT